MNLMQSLFGTRPSREQATASLDFQEAVAKATKEALEKNVGRSIIKEFLSDMGKVAFWGKVPAVEEVIGNADKLRKDLPHYPTQAELDEQVKIYEAEVEKAEAEAKAKLN